MSRWQVRLLQVFAVIALGGYVFAIGAFAIGQLRPQTGLWAMAPLIVVALGVSVFVVRRFSR